MDKAIKHHFKKDIKEQIRLTGGWTYQTWLLILSDNQKVVFRTQRDFITAGGREVIIANVLEREKFFYDNVNKVIGHICPEVYVVDGTREHHENSYCIMEYIEGTPLNQCFNDFDMNTKNEIQYKIGEIAARINNIEIDNNHSYILNREPWENFMATRLRERFSPLIKNEVISQSEIDEITGNMQNKKTSKTLSFLHLDMRHVNMIYNNGDIFILDAENCEFGDPLCELAVIDMGGELDSILINGYKNAYNGDIDLNNELYYYYKIERAGLVLNVFMNSVKSDTESTQHYLKIFNETKNKLLS